MRRMVVPAVFPMCRKITTGRSDGLAPGSVVSLPVRRVFVVGGSPMGRYDTVWSRTAAVTMRPNLEGFRDPRLRGPLRRGDRHERDDVVIADAGAPSGIRRGRRGGAPMGQVPDRRAGVRMRPACERAPVLGRGRARG